jgi:hypothetical protein
MPRVIRGGCSCGEGLKLRIDPELRIDWYEVRHFHFKPSVRLHLSD